MKTEYSFTPKEYISGTYLSVIDDEASHLLRVLRKKNGDIIFVTDGAGMLYKCEIESVRKDIAECKILETYKDLNEPKLKVSLYFSLLRNHDRLEYAIEKSVELGVYEIHPIITERVVNKSANRTERWQKIALSAMKQSCRSYLPLVNEPVMFSDAVSSAGGFKLIAHEKANESIKSSFSDSSCSLFIGPEGGFTDNEIKMAYEKNIIPFQLGNRKFRSETAVVVSLTKLLL